MSIFSKYLLNRDELLSRRIEINSSSYEQLQSLTKKYHASINDLVNVALVEMIKTKNISFHEISNRYSEYHSFRIRKSSYIELEKLKEKYKLSITQLTNIAIYNALQAEKEKM